MDCDVSLNLGVMQALAIGWATDPTHDGFANEPL